MAPRGFDHFMVQLEAGRNLKLNRLSPAERLAWLLGVLPIAAKAPLRGSFMIGSLPAEAEDVAAQASVPKSVASSMLGKVRELGMLEHDDDIGAEWVHDFEEHNPEPKRDSTAAKRAKAYRDRQKAKRDEGGASPPPSPVTAPSRRDDAVRHGTVTPPEVEEEEKNTPQPPPEGEWTSPPVRPIGGRKRDLARYDEQLVEFAVWLLPDHPDPDRREAVRAAVGWVSSRPDHLQFTVNNVRIAALNVLTTGTCVGAPPRAVEAA